MTALSAQVNDFLKSVFPENVKAYITPCAIDFAMPEDGVLSDEQLGHLKDQGFPVNKIQTMTQIHGDIVLRAPLPPHVDWEGDGMITHKPGLVLTIRTADCLPIFLYDPQNKAVGLVHAGWRGTKAQIAAKALAAMFEAYRTKPDDVIVAFGPSIGAEAYEVGAEFKEHFPAETKQSGDKYCFDMAAANRGQLISKGVKEQNIRDCGICTFSSQELFSYRRQGKAAGRFMSLIMIKE